MCVPMPVVQHYSGLTVQDPRHAAVLQGFARLDQADREDAALARAYALAGPDALYWGWLVAMGAIALLKALL